MPASGNEKPVVENRVKTWPRRWGTPVPRVKNFEELNASLRECCLQDQSRPSRDAKITIGERLQHDRQNAASLPQHRFDACIQQPAKVDKYQFARFDNVSYSVPRTVAFQTVTVKGDVDRIDIVHELQVVADRYERRSLLITSNLAFSDWGQIFQGERMTAALLDRLTHRHLIQHRDIFEMNGESDRFRESMKQKKQPRKKS